MRLAAAILIGASVLAGCGDDDSGDASPTTEASDTTTTTADDPTTTSTTEPEAVDTRTEEARARDLAAAEAIVLKLEDLGPRWTAWPPFDVDTEGLEADFVSCLGLEVDEVVTDDPTAASETFTPGDDRSFRVEVTITASEHHAQSTFDLHLTDRMAQCTADDYRDFVEQTFASGGDFRDDLAVGEVIVERLPLAPIGDSHAGTRYTVPVTGSDLYAPIHIDVLITQVGRTIIYSSFTNTLTPFPEDDSARMVEIMAQRIPTDL